MGAFQNLLYVVLAQISSIVCCNLKQIQTSLLPVYVSWVTKYHAQDIHSWNGGQCDFHDLRECTCGKCEAEITCDGKEYHAKNPLKCPFHALAYKIECYNRASQADQIIHTELGRGHSNYPEASHNVLVRFRSKDKYLQSIHYMVSTNMGLLQANMTWLGKKYGTGS